MEKLITNAVFKTAPSAVETSAVSCSELAESTPVEVLSDSRGSALGIVSEVHDSRIQGDLERALEYSEAHPGRVGEITMQERTLAVFPKDDGRKVIDAFEGEDIETWQALTKLGGCDVRAIWGKESIVRIKIKN